MDIITCDFETSTVKYSTKEAHVYLWGIYNKDLWLYGYDIGSFIETCYNFVGKHDFYFHNLKFDGEFILHHLLDNDFIDISTSLKEEDKESFTKRKHVLSKIKRGFDVFQDSHGKIYSLLVKKDNALIKFKCSYNILNVSLKNLAKELNMEVSKLKIDYHKYNKNQLHLVKKDKLLHQYLKNDCIIPYKAIIKLYNEVTDFGNLKNQFGLTSSSISLKAFQYYVNKYKYERDDWVWKEFIIQKKLRVKRTTPYNILFDGKRNGINREFHNLLRLKFYRGGYTGGKFEDVDKWIICKNGTSYDVNSLYPSVMMKLPIPVGKVLYKKPDFEHLEYLLLNIYEIKPKKKTYIPLIKNILGKHLKEINGKTLYLKYFEGSKKLGHYLEMGFLKEELEFIEKYYNLKYEVKNRYWFRSSNIMNEYIKKVMYKKVYAKTEVERLVAKLAQNSLYGKFGQSVDKGRMVYKKADGPINKGIVVYGKNIVRQEYIGFNKEGNYRNPLVAATITTYARLELWKAIFANYENFLYCDTDSIWLKDQAVNIKIDDKKYGYWKVEKKYKEFKWIRPKCYAYVNLENEFKCTVSGLSNEKKYLVTKDNFKIGLMIEDVKKQARRVKGGILILDTKFTIKDSFKNNVSEVQEIWEKKLH